MFLGISHFNQPERAVSGERFKKFYIDRLMGATEILNQINGGNPLDEDSLYFQFSLMTEKQTYRQLG
ncbi:hypothetical protein ACA30_10525 [Virgibacillus soli]|nr:hypothetical protein ACA30_10525 [Virgibacillus soli]